MANPDYINIAFALANRDKISQVIKAILERSVIHSPALRVSMLRPCSVAVNEISEIRYSILIGLAATPIFRSNDLLEIAAYIVLHWWGDNDNNPIFF